MDTRIIALMALGACGSQTETRDPVVPQIATTKRVLIVGDSISIGYYDAFNERISTPGIKFLHNQNPKGSFLATNAMNTQWGVNMIEYWLDQAGPVDLVTYNQGLWDIGGEWGPTPAENYLKNVSRILDAIQRRGIKVIMFNTSYVPTRHFRPLKSVQDLNALAVDYALTHNIRIYNLYELTTRLTQYFLEGPEGTDCHFNDRGNDFLAQFVLGAVKENL